MLNVDNYAKICYFYIKKGFKMAQLPTNEQLTGEISTAQYKASLANMREFVSQIPGGSPVEVVSIVSSKIIPSKSIIEIKVDNQSASSISIIDMTNYSDGQILMISTDQPDTIATIRHDFGGIGSVFLVDEKDLLVNYKSNVVLVKSGTAWIEKSYTANLFDGDIIKTALLPSADAINTGLVRLSDSEDIAKGSSDSVVMASQLKTQRQEVEKIIEEKIYPASLVQQQENTSASLVLKENVAIYTSNIEADTTFTFDNSSITKNTVITFELVLNVIGDFTVNFPENTVWLNNEQPFYESGKRHIIVFRSMDDGITWVGNLAGRY